MFEKKFFTQTHLNKAGNGFKNSKGAYYRVFNNGYSKHFRDVTSGTKLENDKRTCLKKKFLLKRIWIRQETDLKIPKALITVFLITVTASIFEMWPRGQSWRKW